MSHLMRALAPITPDTWEAIDAEARRTLALLLAARRLVDFDGPHGWDSDAVGTGRVEALEVGPLREVSVHRRRVQPLIELRAGFRLERAELEAAARGAEDADLQPVLRAAERIAHAEDLAIFHGFPAGDVQGIASASIHDPLPISDDYSAYPATVVEAMERLRQAGVAGPYGIALGPRCYAGLLKASDPHGFPALERLEHLLEGPIVRAPAVDGAVVLSLRGGDFELTVGQDFAVGFRAATAEHVELYLVESFAFRTLSPEAAVHLAYH